MADLAWLRRKVGKAPVVVAHRGASGLAPENTLAAFRLAVKQGAPAVECDVHLSSDGHVIVIHDATVDRTTDGSGPVAEMTLAQLRALDAGRSHGAQFGSERIPTLDESLAVCMGHARLFVEIKGGGGEALVDATLAAIDRARGVAVAVISFGKEEVRLVAQKRPDLALGFLVGRPHVIQHGVGSVLTTARELGASFISPHHEAIDADFVSAAHAAGLPVSVWTADDPERLRTLAGFGVDAVTTNRPDVALGVFGHS